MKRTVRAMSDLERQKISTSVDNMEVDDSMAMGAKRQKMELDVINLSSLTLLCQAVDEDKTFLGPIFSVDVSSSLLVTKLKEQVFEKTKTVLGAGIGALQLTLWKVSIPTGRTNAEKTEFRQKIQAMEFPDDETDDDLNGNEVQLLDPTEQVDTYWTEEPERKRLHLIVGVPRRSIDDGKLLSFIPYSKH
jgi:Crinkler effector protein N-terminal domain